MDKAVIIHVRGLVQGVGFRPFIFLLAMKKGVNGWVRNTNEGVEIFAQASQVKISDFIRRIRCDAPPASVIEELNFCPVSTKDYKSFKIKGSEDRSANITGISPDIAVCDECIEDMEVQAHRSHYPFINCTNCGPRFSIIRDLPYDRGNTSMNVFSMCERCRAEYKNVRDRRFHAQPIACLHCGPRYELISHGERIIGDTQNILSAVSQMLSEGKIIAMKGIGGFHLACDAFNEQAVIHLRAWKQRDGKPFALMFRDIESISAYAKAGEYEMKALSSWQRPIVILDLKEKTRRDPLFSNINSGLSSIGVFLPYMPVHYLLFRYFRGPAIILTSGNLSAEPIIKDEEEALSRFKNVANGLLTYNREIINRSDDSVLRVMGEKPRMIRRSRGYVPAPFPVALDVNNIVAFGAEQSSVFCVGRGTRAFPGTFIGDLKNMATHTFFEQTLKDFIRIFRVKPELLVCDLHPAYFSTKLAEKYGSLPLIRVQHHHAHIASCMAEHGLDEKVIGVALDGTGYGSDGKIWGGEFMVSDLVDFRRVIHFDYIPLPGGDKAVEEPWRTAIAYLYRVFGKNFLEMPFPFFQYLDRKKITSVINMLERGINCPEVSSAGRLFDAVSAMLGLCLESTFQAEAPMRLESNACQDCEEVYSYKIGKTIRVDEMIRGIAEDILNKPDVKLISAKFHNTIISIIFESVKKISKQEKISKVVLSGGVFQNRYMLERTEILLRKSGMLVFSNEKIPANDGGIALGQLIIAAKRRNMKCV